MLPVFHDVAVISADELFEIEMAPFRQLASDLKDPLGVTERRYEDLVRVLHTTTSIMVNCSPFDALAALRERYGSPCVERSKD
jgi:hypothetical protein